MEVEQAERVLRRTWGSPPALVTGRRVMRWGELVALLPAPVRQRAGGHRMPALALVVALRDGFGAAGRPGAAAIVSAWLAERLESLLGAEHPDVLLERAATGAWLLKGGSMEAAREALATAYNGLWQIGVTDHRLAAVGEHLAHVLAADDEYDLVEEVLEVTWRIRRQQSVRAGAKNAARLGEVRLRRGDVAGALPLLREAWESREPPLQPWEQSCGRALGRAFVQREDYASASAVLREVVRLPLEDSVGADAAFLLARSLEATGATEEALRTAEGVLGWTRAHAPEHPALATRITLVARMAFARGHVAEAEGLLHEAMELDERTHGADSSEVGRRYAELGRLCLGTGRVEEAVGWLEAAVALLRRHLGDADPRTRQAAEAWAGALYEMAERAKGRGDPQTTRWLVEQLNDLASGLLAREHPTVAKARALLP